MAGQLNYDPAEHYRLCEDVPDADEFDLARQMAEESSWEDESEAIEQ